MKDFVKRMIEEYNELHERVSKLESFFETEVYNGLSNEEKQDLFTQYHAMLIYKMALGRRLLRKGVDKSQDAKC